MGPGDAWTWRRALRRVSWVWNREGDCWSAEVGAYALTVDPDGTWEVICLGHGSPLDAGGAGSVRAGKRAAVKSARASV